ncbi:MAG: carbohydrate kinase [Candidatus Dormiibacter spiritus]|nr:MAG: carbohydrate kinase [Candidatus Dormibacteraeota bacterium]
MLVCGEALIDLAETGAGRYSARPAGSPCNVAIACARLGVPVAYFGRLSTDHFGSRLRTVLVEEGIDLRHTLSGNEPTPLAFVHLEADREPQYGFYVEGTVDHKFGAAELPRALSGEIRAVHFGSFSLVLEPGASAFEALLRREAADRVISLDPNVRPSLIPERAAYVRRLLTWLPNVDLVKASEADLAWLHPGEIPEVVARRWLAPGPALIVVTLGSRGAMAITPHQSVFRATPQVEVVDTVGAGDAFMAGLLAALGSEGALQKDALHRLSDPALARTLDHALRVAAITCSRPGADPPYEHELGTHAWLAER